MCFYVMFCFISENADVWAKCKDISKSSFSVAVLQRCRHPEATQHALLNLDCIRNPYLCHSVLFIVCYIVDSEII